MIKTVATVIACLLAAVIFSVHMIDIYRMLKKRKKNDD